jgi:hypothetical protein
LWQNDLVGVRIEQRLSWIARSYAVVRVEGVYYYSVGSPLL